MTPVTRDPMERFMEKVMPEPNSGCWLWMGAINEKGYGRFNRGKRGAGTCMAHVFAYERFVGPVPEGLECDHLCRTRSCVNPRHIEAVTHRVNMLRGDTVGAACAKKVYCYKGHLLPVTRDRRGKRICQICKCEYRRHYYQTRGK